MDPLARLQDLLRTLFQLDTADLDFGIYRLYHLKRQELDTFIDEQIPQSVQRAFGQVAEEQQAALLEEVHDLQNQVRDWLGDDALASDGSVQEEHRDAGGHALRELLADYEAKRNALQQVEATEAQQIEVFNHLYAFFSRYYEDGDFIPKRRYGMHETYAVPYDGQEVYLHWANKGQHYVKTGERLRDYAFTVEALGGPYRVRFQLVEATVARENTKGETRFFFPRPDSITYADKTLVVPFEYRLPTEEELQRHGKNARGQAAILEEALDPILEAVPEDALALALKGIVRETEKEQVSLLLQRLRHFTQKQTSDFFVHKDLKGFLTRELEFYIKDQVLHLGDLRGDLPAKLRIIQVFRQVAEDIITFLDQLERVQCRLFEKKKFVLRTDYLCPIQHVPRELWGEVLENDAQRAEWRDLYGIEGTLDETFLATHPTLVVHTAHFPEAFTLRLLAAFDDIEEATGGLLVHGENYQALTLLQGCLSNQVKCIYIDPPYNRQGDDFLYKDRFRHSSWLAMMYERLDAARPLLREDGVLFASIDENERSNLETTLSAVLGPENRVEELVWAQNTTHSQSPLYSTNHEYIEVFARNRPATERAPAMFREPKPGYTEVIELVEELNPSYPSISEVEAQIAALMDRHREEYEAELREAGLPMDEDARRQDPWRGIYPYKHAEYRDAQGDFVPEDQARGAHARICVWQEADASAPAQKQSESTLDPSDPNFRFYQPLHPVTGKPCPHPKRGWAWPYTWDEGGRSSFQGFAAQHRIVWGEDERKVPRFKRFLHEVEWNVAKSFFHDYTDGEKQVAALFGRAAAFPNPKPTTLVSRFIAQTCAAEDVVLDFFAGSGTTAHAVIALNREDRGRRRFVLAEMGAHFDSVLLPRVQKVMYSPDWKDGLPTVDPQLSLQGLAPEWMERTPRLVTILRLEGYDDSLSNLSAEDTLSAEAPRAEGFRQLLDEDQYRLHYLARLPLEASDSLLDVARLAHPFSYRLQVLSDEGPRESPVDLVETFSLLYGLRVKRIETWRNDADGRAYRAVRATKRGGQRVLVLWRDMEGLDPAVERTFLEGRIQGYDEVLINGDAAVPGVQSLDPLFKRLMEAGEA
ncbi:MAG TPA: site-specific DNA-methyltransferase [Chloroflexi bacterium]|nr:site-specific DNA-methyltransferase [Chloroflexota bacterium]